MYKIETQLRKFKSALSLTDLDYVLLSLWFEMKPGDAKVNLDTNLGTLISEHSEHKVKKQMQNKLSDRIWELGSLNLLNAIVNQTPVEIGFMQEQIEVLPKEILPKLGSYTNIKASDPRSDIAKKLGCTITA